MNKIAFLTTIFPMNGAYLYDFFNSLQCQTYKNFDVIVVNDGYENLEKITTGFKSLNIIEIQHSDLPSKNREFGINYVKKNAYEVLIFGDSDDFFEDRRVECCVAKLKVFDIVVNDLSLFYAENDINKKYISNRLENNTKIDLEFIKNKNIFGLSNTAVKVSILENIHFDKDLVAIDWYLYSILLARGYSAIFTNEVVTFYRQYDSNTIGMASVTKESLSKGILVKLKHYKLLKEIHSEFESFYDDMIELQRITKDEQYIEYIKQKNPLWWEEIKLLSKA